MAIAVNELLKVYGEQKAVNAISFTAKKGEIVGFLGPNGAGKSTTMKMLTGHLQPDGGDAIICNMNIKTHALEVKRKIGYLPETNALYYDMYVKEYLHFVAGVYKLSSIKAAIEAAINAVGLQPEYKKKIGELSKGYKQRVGLAAALVHNPEVLILDEPTSGLDPNQIVEIRELIKQLGKDKTVLFSTHIMQEVEAVCDRVIIINKGNIVANDLLANLGKNSGNSIVKIKFKEKLDRQWLLQLSATVAVFSPDEYNWEIETDLPELLKRQVLQLSVNENLNIISIEQQNTKLEDVFRQLTL